MIRNAVRISLIASVALSALAGAAAQAQDGDVLVMRRAIVEAKGSAEAPAPTPTDPEAPGTDPTPAPTPTPTPSNPNAEWRASALSLVAGGIQDASSQWANVTVGSERCWDSSTQEIVGNEECEGKPADPLLGVKTVPAAVYPGIRGIYLNIDSIAALMPALVNRDSFCSSSYTLDGSKYGVRCDSNPGDISIVRVPTAVDFSEDNDPHSGTVGITFTSYQCRDTATGEVTSVPQCSALPGTPDLQLEAGYSIPLRTMAFDASQIEAIAPTVTSGTSLCTKRLKVAVDGQVQNWKASCDPSEIEEHYEKYATYISAVNQSYPFNGNYQASTGSAGVRCLDTETGEDAADQSKCTYLSNPPSIGLLTFPSVDNPSNRTVVVTREDILAQSPRIENLDSWCMSSVNVNVEGSNSKWRVRCDPAALNDTYESYIWQIQRPTQAMPEANLEIRLSTPGCRNLDNGQEISLTFCDTLPDAYRSGQTVTVPVLGVSSELRTIALDRETIDSVFASANTNLCNTSVNIYRSGTSGSSDSWKLRCGLNEIAEVYERRYRRVAGPNPYPNANDTTISLKRYDSICWDTAADILAEDQSKCDFITTSPENNSSTPIPAIYSEGMRRVWFDKDAFDEAYPHVSIGDPCNLGIRVYRSVGTNNDIWTTTCDLKDIDEDRYERRHTRIIIPSPYNSKDDTTISFRRSTPTCWDKEAGEAVDSSICEFLPSSNSPQDYSSTPVPAIFNADLRKIWVDEEAFREAYPWVETDVCNYNANVYRNGSSGTNDNWKTTCDREEIDSDRYYREADLLFPPNGSYQPRNPFTEINLRVYTIKCMDRKTGGPAADPKTCDYLPASHGPALYDYFKIPAITDSATKTVTIQTDDIYALHPNANLLYICPNRSVSVYRPGTTSSSDQWKIDCQ